LCGCIFLVSFTEALKGVSWSQQFWELHLCATYIVDLVKTPHPQHSFHLYILYYLNHLCESWREKIACSNGQLSLTISCYHHILFFKKKINFLPAHIKTPTACRFKFDSWFLFCLFWSLLAQENFLVLLDSWNLFPRLFNLWVLKRGAYWKGVIVPSI
jgi:hypothetical protein